MAHAVRPILLPDMLIAPVPLHWSRFLKRRYNQSALLAQSVARDLNTQCCPDLLHRHRRTAMLDKKGAEERIATLSGAIAINPNHASRVQGAAVLLVDDVLTTGATLNACASACLRAGAKDVRVLVLARVAKEL